MSTALGGPVIEPHRGHVQAFVPRNVQHSVGCKVSEVELHSALQRATTVPDQRHLSAYDPMWTLQNRIPVIIQSMVDAQAAGVLFTRHPIKGSTMLINSTWDSGKPIVDGRVQPDEFEIGDGGRIVSQSIAEKEWAFTLAGERHPVGRDLRDKPSLSPQDLTTLATLGARIADLFGCQQDIEWSSTVRAKRGLFSLARLQRIKGPLIVTLPSDYEAAARERKVIPFIGAGFSKNISTTMPNWGEVMDVVASNFSLRSRSLKPAGRLLADCGVSEDPR